MYAEIYHARRFSKKVVVDEDDGSEMEELQGGVREDVPMPGFERMVEQLRSQGVSDDDMPFYYGDYSGDVDIDDLTQRCTRFKAALARLGKNAGEGKLLAKFQKWLAAGEFVVAFA